MTAASRYAHLHVHSEYSLLDGAARIKLQDHHARGGDTRIKSLVSHARSLGMNAVALTDHGNMCGAIEFYRETRRQGVKAILGMEAYVAPGSRLDKTAKMTEPPHHLTLLVKEERGRANLTRMASLAHEEGFHYRPRVDRDLLVKYHDGLIVLSGCLKGELSCLLLAGKADEAEKVAGWYKDLLGADRYFIELQDQGIPEQKLVVRGLVTLARNLGLSTVVTNDVHYLEKEDALMHEVLLCIQTGKTLADPDRLKFQTQEFYLKSPAEMADLFRELPEAVERSGEIAERCGLEMVFADDSDKPRFHFPHFPIPPEFSSADDYLRHLCMDGAKRRYGELRGEIMERMDSELNIIARTGFTPIFLIVSDIVRFAKERGILVGPGRGSAVGSIVAYVTGITDLDPVRFGLIFERFLHLGRTKELPDIDIDFPDNRREEVVEYIRRKYGEGNVAQIVTFARMNARAVVRDVGRVMGLTYGETDRLAKMIPGGPSSTLARGMETVELKAAVEQKPEYRRLLEVARSLESVARHASKHAAGVVIAPPAAGPVPAEGGLREHVPLLRLEEGVHVTQFDMEGIKQLGLVKIDILGLRTLTVLDESRRIVRRNRGEDVDYLALSLDDAETYRLFAEGKTDGIFQFESSGMRDALRKLKPDSIEDLIALNALYRPGPMEQIDAYIHRRRGEETATYDVPELEPILKATYGIVVYQEQVLQIVNQLGGYSMGKADDFRRSMGKKKAAIMTREKENFIKGAVGNGIPKKDAEDIFHFLEKFAGYGFNRSHSAAYALLAYWTAYMKVHYPVEFMAALLTSEMGSQEKVAEYVGECRKIRVEVLPPDVNRSRTDFSVEPSNGKAAVRFGMAAVKNVGRTATDAIIRERDRGGPFKSLANFCERVDGGTVNRKVLESLVKCGAFDATGQGREQLIAALPAALERGARRQEDRSRGQEMLFGGEAGEEAGDVPLPETDATPERNRLSYEKELLGCYVSGHPLAEYEEELKVFSTQSLKPDKLSEAGGYPLKVAGVASRVQNGVTKKKEPYIRFQIEDLEGSIEALAWPEVVRRVGGLVTNGAILMVTGTLQRQTDGRSTLIAREIMPLEEAQVRLTRAVHLSINTVGTDAGMLKSLQQVASLSPGGAALYLHLKTLHHGEAILEASQETKVKPTRELIAQFRALLGEEAVALSDRLLTPG